jgi:antitoxin (DNA-binding transcriptional repressor) of toxin-antitoxin stability system
MVTPASAAAKVSTNVVTGIRPAMRSRQNVVTPPLGRFPVRDLRFGSRINEVCRHSRSQGALSELARAAAKGEATILTDYGKPVAVIGPSSRRPWKKPVLTQGNSIRLCRPSRIICTWVSRATDLSDREECIEDLAHRHRAVYDPQASAKRAAALHQWLDGLVTTFSDRIHPIDVNVAIRAGRLLP